jgi:excisionase family DNA binding protein
MLLSLSFEAMSDTNPPPQESNDQSEDQLWTTPEVAKYLCISLKTVFELRKRRGLPYVKLGGAVRFVPQEIKVYLINSRRLSSHRLQQIARKGGVI